MNDWTEITLDEAWDWCISMWSSISRRCLKDTDTRVNAMKMQYLEKHGIKPDELDQDCFFCQYDRMMETKSKANQYGLSVEKFLEEHDEMGDCQFCPGKLIDHTFHCTSPYYHFEDKPRHFYKKVRQLYKKYLNE
jgi:hypothetical protein